MKQTYISSINRTKIGYVLAGGAMLFRDISSELLDWVKADNPKCLVIRGARQVGKTTAVLDIPTLHSGEQQILYMNLEEHPELEHLFNSMNAERILEELSFSANVNLSAGVIVFLDEVQAAPSALCAMRYMREHRPDIYYVAAGSLLEMALSKKKISIPVGRMDYNFLGPLTFEEFLMSDGSAERELELIRKWIPGYSFPLAAHRRLVDLLRQFLVVGGMPEAVETYLSSRDTSEVGKIHSSILNTYRDDFAKYASGEELLILRRVFDWVPARAGDKVIYSQISPHLKAGKVRSAIELLSGARVIFPVVHSSGNGVPLNAESRPSVFKLYFLDVGLMSNLTGIVHISQDQILNAEFVNSGRLAEQFIAQHLLFRGPSFELPSLHYWLRKGRISNAEVDFLIHDKGHVIPVEVKTGASGRMKSLMRFIQEKNSSLAVRFDMNPPSIQKVEHMLGNGVGESSRVAFDLLSLPLYMVGEISRLIDWNRIE
jgi:predicted AAA+ superfamily ATPase